MIYGFNRPNNVALIVAAMPAVEQFAQNNGMSGSGESLLNESSIRDLFREELSVYGRNFKSFENPQNFALLAEEWSIENGLLTPTLKLKREVVEQKFKDQIESLY